MNTKWMTRSEAAMLLGVTPQTISNYAAQGLLHEDKRGKFSRYPREEVEALDTFPEVHSIEDMRNGIERMQAEMRHTYLSVKDLYEERRKAFLEGFGATNQKWANYKQVVYALVTLVSQETLTGRERDIVYDILSLRSFEHICADYGITPERVRQIFQRALRNMVKYRSVVDQRIAVAENKATALAKENLNLKDQIFQLQHPEVPANIDKLDIYRFGHPFTTRISDLPVSVRLFNALRATGVETVGDIVAYKSNEYMRLRNFGRKTLWELQNLLEKMHLDFGMWTNPEYPTLNDLKKKEYA